MSNTTCLISGSEPREGDVRANALLILGGKSNDVAAAAAIPAADPNKRRRVNLHGSESRLVEGIENFLGDFQAGRSPQDRSDLASGIAKRRDFQASQTGETAQGMNSVPIQNSSGTRWDRYFIGQDTLARK
jgi:hypothetical protein